MATNYKAVQYWTLHWEKELPRTENYRKKTLARLEKLVEKLTRYIGWTQEELDKYPDSVSAKMWMTMYKYHHQMALLAIAAKTGKMRAA